MAKKDEKREYEPVDASPVKSFFVTMLTRDIQLSDAILDLLDNSVDGILRSKKGKVSDDKPYHGFVAEIEFDSDSFLIRDNCGGIPWSLHDYAFRMGRADPNRDTGLPTVGTYGIGMKRALFKMGEQCLITTQNGKDNYIVEISPAWIKDEDKWDIPVKADNTKMKEDGTEILIKQLHGGIASQFGKDYEAFAADLTRKIASHYAFIIDKGLTVKINGKVVVPKPTKLVFAKDNGKQAIRPFLYRTDYDGVNVFLAVGFTRPIPSQESVIDEQQERKYSSLDAGWTILCNDRAVLYCDKTELTGWGEAGVPGYHTQFTAISGIVEFVSNDASKLPTTTSKRGIDASSTLYLKVKNKMREGMAIFTDYTNKWKGRTDEAKAHMEDAPAIPLTALKERSEKLQFTKVGSKTHPGEQYKPKLPIPVDRERNIAPIHFRKPVNEVEILAEYLFDDVRKAPSKVGEKCFDEMLKEAKK
jgi:hypothetical protein